MKLLKMMLLVCVAILMAVPAFAEIYVSGAVGGTKNTGSGEKNGVRADYSDSFTYTLAVGYDFPMVDLLRMEAEYLHNRAKVNRDIGKTNINSLMINGYMDIPVPLPIITPYVGVGIGPSRYEKDTLFSYQGMIGMDAEIFVIPMIASIEYRYTGFDNKSKSDGGEYKSYLHSLFLKLRYNF